MSSPLPRVMSGVLIHPVHDSSPGACSSLCGATRSNMDSAWPPRRSYKRSAMASDAGTSRTFRSSMINRKATCLCAIACDTTTSTIFAFSVAGRRWKASRAGVLANRCSTSIRVPCGMPKGSTSPFPPSIIWIRFPSDSCGRLAMLKPETMPMLANASPRKPSV